MQRELDLHRVEWEDDAASLRALENPGAEQRRHVAVHGLDSRSTRRAVSRMETSPTPHNDFRISHRFAVSTFHSNSGEVNAIRADVSALLLFHALANPDIAASGARTSSVTVFMLPPRDCGFEVCEQSLGGGEPICTLTCAVVPVIALSRLVVKAEHARAIHDERQSIFEAVGGASNRYS